MTARSETEVWRMCEADGLELTQVSPGRWDAESLIAREGPWMLDYFRTELDLRVMGRRPQGDFAVIMSKDGAGRFSHLGNDLPLGHILMRGDRYLSDEIIAAGTAGLAARAEAGYFRENILPLFPQAAAAGWTGAGGGALLTVPEVMLPGLREEFANAERVLRSGSCAKGVVATTALNLFGIALDCAGAEAVGPSALGESGGYHLLKVVERIFRNSPDSTTTLPDLCRAAGCSQRSLHNALVKHVGVSPHRYLRMLRMNAARRDLLDAAGSGSERVTRVAMKWGFEHLGRFSRDYRDMFGELPRETMKRSRPRPGVDASGSSAPPYF